MMTLRHCGPLRVSLTHAWHRLTKTGSLRFTRIHRCPFPPERVGARIRTAIRRTLGYMAKRKISAKQRRIYRRRRIIAALVAVVFLVLCWGIGWLLVRGVSAVNYAINKDDINAISREAAPSPKEISGVQDCTGDDVDLTLSANSATASLGGSVQFVATIKHHGASSCLIDGSNASRVLTITSGNETIWRSDSCPVDSRMLLMAGNDKDIQTITWNANATTSQCQQDSALLNVQRGTYVAKLSLKEDAKVQSAPVSIAVQ